MSATLKMPDVIQPWNGLRTSVYASLAACATLHMGSCCILSIRPTTNCMALWGGIKAHVSEAGAWGASANKCAWEEVLGTHLLSHKSPLVHDELDVCSLAWTSFSIMASRNSYSWVELSYRVFNR